MSWVNRRGRPPLPDVLTPAEWEVLDQVRHGATNRAIARRRRTSLDATKFHVANLLIKLDLPDRSALRSWRGAPRGSAAARKKESTMSGNVQLGPIGQISREVTDIRMAEDWYKNVSLSSSSV